MTQTTFGEPADSTMTVGHAVRDPANGGRTAGGLAFDDQGSGEPVVLLHAGVADRRMWDPLVSRGPDSQEGCDVTSMPILYWSDLPTQVLVTTGRAAAKRQF